jgi:hypothetical protein
MRDCKVNVMKLENCPALGSPSGVASVFFLDGLVSAARALSDHIFERLAEFFCSSHVLSPFLRGIVTLYEGWRLKSTW